MARTAYIQLACAAARGFAIIEGDSMLRYLATPLAPEDEPYTRFNDGACDSKGRFLAGTICSRERDVPGRLYMYDPHEDTCTLIDPGPFTVGNVYSLSTCNILSRSFGFLFPYLQDSNGLGWSADGRTLWAGPFKYARL